MLPPFITRRSMIGSAGLVAVSTGAAAIDLKDFGGKAGEDIGPALRRALEQGGGAPINIGPGEYRLASPFIYHNRDKLGASRAPGLVLIGAGSQRTIIDCSGLDDVAIEIGQEVPYRFTVGGRLEGFTLRGNRQAPQQDGLRLSGAYNYTISDVWVTGFTGNALSFPARFDLRWELPDVELTAGSKIARRTAKLGFNEDMRIWPTVRIFGPGIAPNATVSRIMDETTLEMSAPATESGTRTIEVTGNSDAFQSIVELVDCTFLRNRGWGIWGGAGFGAIVNWVRTESSGNKGGGVFCGGNAWTIRGGAIAGNGNVGLLVDRVMGGPLILEVERIEFDSNAGSQVFLKEINTAVFERCRFISHYDPDTKNNIPEIGVVIGNTPATRVVRGVELRGCQFRAPPTSTDRYSAIRFGAPGGYQNIQIINPSWVAKAAQHRFFDNDPDPGGNVLLQEDGITKFAGRTARAWAVLERRSTQTIAGGRPRELVFDLMQGNLGGSATPQEIRTARATLGSDQLQVETTAGLRPGLPIADATGQFVADGTIVAMASKQIQISSPATSDGDFALVVGGMRVPYAQLYEIDASVTVEGAAAGSAIELALTVDGRPVRKSILAAGPVQRQSVALRAMLPLQAGVRVGLRLSHDGRGNIVALGGAEGGGFSMIAAT